MRSTHPTQPTYATLEIGWDSITYKCYQIMNVLGKDKNGNTIIDAEPCLACKKYLKFAGINTYINLTGEHELI